LHDLQDGRLLDLGTKGSGKIPWSRGGDGRLTLKGGAPIADRDDWTALGAKLADIEAMRVAYAGASSPSPSGRGPG